jgi:hypothetical protein
MVFVLERIKAILTPYRAPNAHAYAERWVRSVREQVFGSPAHPQ